MDFEYPYSEEQERFRKEVRTWLEENIPQEMRSPTDPADFTEEMYLFWKEKHKELGAKGWLFPTYPKEYGGGGLAGEHETIIQEEFHHYRVKGNFTVDVVLPALLVWGTEEQRQKFLAPILRGQKNAWQKFTEPKSGADLASYQSTAARDGDEWVLNGSNVFCSGLGSPVPDWIFGPMLTDPEAPRHRNLGYFIIPYPSPGLELKVMNTVDGHDLHFVYLDSVRVPGDHLIGGDHEGWQVTNTSLEREHGGHGQAFHRDAVVDNLVRHMQGKRQKGESPEGDSVSQQKTVDAHIEAHVDGLFAKRTYWMYQSRVEMSWEGPLNNLFGRECALRNVKRVQDVMGMYALLGTKEPGAPHGGAQEVNQRVSFIRQHGAGSLNIAKVVLARRIGISRTKERAAPTPATATTYTS